MMIEGGNLKLKEFFKKYPFPEDITLEKKYNTKIS